MRVAFARRVCLSFFQNPQERVERRRRDGCGRSTTSSLRGTLAIASDFVTNRRIGRPTQIKLAELNQLGDQTANEFQA